jgi:hypothetical protein
MALQTPWLLSRVYEQKVAAADREAVRILESTSPVAWRNINLIGNFDFINQFIPRRMEAMAACYQNEDFLAPLHAGARR